MSTFRRFLVRKCCFFAKIRYLRFSRQNTTKTRRFAKKRHFLVFLKKLELSVFCRVFIYEYTRVTMSVVLFGSICIVYIVGTIHMYYVCTMYCTYSMTQHLCLVIVKCLNAAPFTHKQSILQ